MIPHSPVLRRLALSYFFLEVQFWFPVWMLFLTARGFDLTTMVLADGVFRFTMVAMEFPLGVFSDHIGRKKSYILIAALATMTYVGIIFINGRLTLFAIWILWGVFWALSSGTTSAYTYELIEAEGRQDESVAIFGFMRAVSSIAVLFSHLAAGFLFTFTPALPFAVSALLALGALAIAFTLPETSEGLASDSFRGPRSPWQFLSVLRQNTTVLVGSTLLALSLIYFWSPRILMQPLFIELKILPVVVSSVFFFYSLAGVLAGLSASRVQTLLGNKPAILAGAGLLWLGVLLVAFAPGRLALLFFPLMSFGYFLSHTLLEVLLHSQLENQYRASMLSAASFVGGAFIIFTRPGLGILADLKSSQFAFVVWAILGVTVLVIFVFLIRRLPSYQVEG